MNKYRVYLQATADLSVVVEAEDPEEALDLALGQHGQYLCPQCAGWGESWSLDIGEWEPAAERDGTWSIDDAVEEVRGSNDSGLTFAEEVAAKLRGVAPNLYADFKREGDLSE